MTPPRLVDLILYVGQHPLRSGVEGLAIACWRSDFGAYLHLGRPLSGPTVRTAARYIVARRPGVTEPRGLLDAVVSGWRWGAISHRQMRGALTRWDAEWVAERWQNGVPV